MKTTKITYWIATIIIFLFDGLLPALTSNTELARQGISHLGYPDYFRVMLTVFKITGAIVLILPVIKGRLKEWAYAGIVFELSGAVASHAACGKWEDSIAPLSLLCLAIASWALRPASRTLETLFHAGGHKRERSSASASI